MKPSTGKRTAGPGILMDNFPHYPVLLQESINALNIEPGGAYVDGTFGRGGHSRKILQALGERGRLFVFDKDPEAIHSARQLQAEDGRLTVFHASFATMQRVLNDAGVARVNGILLDLGVSSPQLDCAQRGFSFMQDGPLDMRMDNSRGMSAAQWLNTAAEEEMSRVFREYGEERFARRMAAAIARERQFRPIERTAELARIVSEANPAWEKGKHPATRVFQAIRIFLNGELDELQAGLVQALDLLDIRGRLAVISFHSLEDRIVKRYFREQSRGKSFPRGVPVTEDMIEKKIKLVGKVTRAGVREVKENVRSRSAVLRVAEKIAD